MSCGWESSYPSDCCCGSSTRSGCMNGYCVQDLRTLPGSILTSFPTTVTTCGQAFSIFGQELKKRLGAKEVFVSVGSSSAWIVTLQLSIVQTDTATATLQVAAQCSYPVTCAWNKAKTASSGLGQFHSLSDLLNYLVYNFRN